MRRGGSLSGFVRAGFPIEDAERDGFRVPPS